MNITTEKNIIHFSGKLSTGVFKIPTNITSQYISAFLIALPYLNQSKIYFENTKSNKYIEITKNLAKKFGVTYEKQNSYYTSKGSYLSPEKIHIEGDWSSASFWYAANINKKNNVMIYNLNKNSLSSDKIILELINKIKNNKETIISANDIPDLIPILTLVSSIFGKTTIIKNIERLRYKESNRVENLKECLNNIGAKIETFENYMVVNNVKTLKGGIGKTFFDHRLAMTLAIASTFSEKPITINNAECVSKSYPGFYNDFHLLGGNVKILS